MLKLNHLSFTDQANTISPFPPHQPTAFTPSPCKPFASPSTTPRCPSAAAPAAICPSSSKKATSCTATGT